MPSFFVSQVLEHTLAMLERSVFLLSLLTNTVTSVEGEEAADVSYH